MSLVDTLPSPLESSLGSPMGVVSLGATVFVAKGGLAGSDDDQRVDAFSEATTTNTIHHAPQPSSQVQKNVEGSEDRDAPSASSNVYQSYSRAADKSVAIKAASLLQASKSSKGSLLPVGKQTSSFTKSSQKKRNKSARKLKSQVKAKVADVRSLRELPVRAARMADKAKKAVRVVANITTEERPPPPAGMRCTRSTTRRLSASIAPSDKKTAGEEEAICKGDQSFESSVATSAPTKAMPVEENVALGVSILQLPTDDVMDVDKPDPVTTYSSASNEVPRLVSSDELTVSNATPEIIGVEKPILKTPTQKSIAPLNDEEMYHDRDEIIGPMGEDQSSSKSNSVQPEVHHSSNYESHLQVISLHQDTKTMTSLTMSGQNNLDLPAITSASASETLTNSEKPHPNQMYPEVSHSTSKTNMLPFAKGTENMAAVSDSARVGSDVLLDAIEASLSQQNQKISSDLQSVTQSHQQNLFAIKESVQSSQSFDSSSEVDVNKNCTKQTSSAVDVIIPSQESVSFSLGSSVMEKSHLETALKVSPIEPHFIPKQDFHTQFLPVDDDTVQCRQELTALHEQKEQINDPGGSRNIEVAPPPQVILEPECLELTRDHDQPNLLVISASPCDEAKISNSSSEDQVQEKLSPKKKEVLPSQTTAILEQCVSHAEQSPNEARLLSEVDSSTEGHTQKALTDVATDILRPPGQNALVEYQIRSVKQAKSLNSSTEAKVQLLQETSVGNILELEKSQTVGELMETVPVDALPNVPSLLDIPALDAGRLDLSNDYILKPSAGENPKSQQEKKTCSPEPFSSTGEANMKPSTFAFLQPVAKSGSFVHVPKSPLLLQKGESRVVKLIHFKDCDKLGDGALLSGQPAFQKQEIASKMPTLVSLLNSGGKSAFMKIPRQMHEGAVSSKDVFALSGAVPLGVGDVKVHEVIPKAPELVALLQPQSGALQQEDSLPVSTSIHPKQAVSDCPESSKTHLEGNADMIGLIESNTREVLHVPSTNGSNPNSASVSKTLNPMHKSTGTVVTPMSAASEEVNRMLRKAPATLKRSLSDTTTCVSSPLTTTDNTEKTGYIVPSHPITVSDTGKEIYPAPNPVTSTGSPIAPGRILYIPTAATSSGDNLGSILSADTFTLMVQKIPPVSDTLPTGESVCDSASTKPVAPHTISNHLSSAKTKENSSPLQQLRTTSATSENKSKKPRLVQMTTEVTDSLGRKLCLLPSLPIKMTRGNDGSSVSARTTSAPSAGILSQALAGAPTRPLFSSDVSNLSLVPNSATRPRDHFPVGILARTLSGTTHHIAVSSTSGPVPPAVRPVVHFQATTASTTVPISLSAVVSQSANLLPNSFKPLAVSQTLTMEQPSMSVFVSTATLVQSQPCEAKPLLSQASLLVRMVKPETAPKLSQEKVSEPVGTTNVQSTLQSESPILSLNTTALALTTALTSPICSLKPAPSYATRIEAKKTSTMTPVPSSVGPGSTSVASLLASCGSDSCGISSTSIVPEPTSSEVTETVPNPVSQTALLSPILSKALSPSKPVSTNRVVEQERSLPYQSANFVWPSTPITEEPNSMLAKPDPCSSGPSAELADVPADDSPESLLHDLPAEVMRCLSPTARILAYLADLPGVPLATDNPSGTPPPLPDLASITEDMGLADSCGSSLADSPSPSMMPATCVPENEGDEEVVLSRLVVPDASSDAALFAGGPEDFINMVQALEAFDGHGNLDNLETVVGCSRDSDPPSGRSSSSVSSCCSGTSNCSAVNSADSPTRQRHRPSSPGKLGPQQCLVCNKVFSNASALAKHKLTHSDERRYACSVCSKAFKRQDHLNGHMLTHRNKKPFECMLDGCSKSYCDARSLRRHEENHHHLKGVSIAKENGHEKDKEKEISRRSSNNSLNMLSTRGDTSMSEGSSSLDGLTSTNDSLDGTCHVATDSNLMLNVKSPNSHGFTNEMAELSELPNGCQEKLKLIRSQITSTKLLPALPGTSPDLSMTVSKANSVVPLVIPTVPPPSASPQGIKVPSSVASKTNILNGGVHVPTISVPKPSPLRIPQMQHPIIDPTAQPQPLSGSSMAPKPLQQSEARSQFRPSDLNIVGSTPQEGLLMGTPKPSSQDKSHDKSVSFDTPLPYVPSVPRTNATENGSQTPQSQLCGTGTSNDLSVEPQEMLSGPKRTSTATETPIRIATSFLKTETQEAMSQQSPTLGPTITRPHMLKTTITSNALVLKEPCTYLLGKAEHAEEFLLIQNAGTTSQPQRNLTTSATFQQRLNGTGDNQLPIEKKSEARMNLPIMKTIAREDCHDQKNGNLSIGMDGKKVVGATQSQAGKVHHFTQKKMQTKSLVNSIISGASTSDCVQSTSEDPKKDAKVASAAAAAAAAAAQNKPVACNLCNRRFKNIPALNGHMRLHGGYFKKESESKRADKRESTGPPLQTASVSVRQLINEKIIQKRSGTIGRVTQLTNRDGVIATTSSPAPAVLTMASTTNFQGRDLADRRHLMGLHENPSKKVSTVSPEFVATAAVLQHHNYANSSIPIAASMPTNATSAMAPASPLPCSSFLPLSPQSDGADQNQLLVHSEDPLLSSTIRDITRQKIDLGSLAVLGSVLIERGGELHLIQAPTATLQSLNTRTFAESVNTNSSNPAISPEPLEEHHQVSRSNVRANVCEDATGSQRTQRSPPSSQSSTNFNQPEGISPILLSEENHSISEMSIDSSDQPPPPKRPRRHEKYPIYTSRLRTCRREAICLASLPYTPAPMLNPDRRSNGLFASVPVPMQCSSTTADGEDSGEASPILAPETDNFPHVNVGARYQCAIPSFVADPYEWVDEPVLQHCLMWSPSVLSKCTAAEVDKYLEFSCSEAVPGAGNNKEFALHVLHMCGGNITDAMTRLMDPYPVLPPRHSLLNYNYGMTKLWDSVEIDIFAQGLRRYRKNFALISNLIENKTAQDCVQLYYVWKHVCTEEYDDIQYSWMDLEDLTVHGSNSNVIFGFNSSNENAPLPAIQNFHEYDASPGERAEGSQTIDHTTVTGHTDEDCESQAENLNATVQDVSLTNFSAAENIDAEKLDPLIEAETSLQFEPETIITGEELADSGITDDQISEMAQIFDQSLKNMEVNDRLILEAMKLEPWDFEVKDEIKSEFGDTSIDLQDTKDFMSEFEDVKLNHMAVTSLGETVEEAPVVVSRPPNVLDDQVKLEIESMMAMHGICMEDEHDLTRRVESSTMKDADEKVQLAYGRSKQEKVSPSSPSRAGMEEHVSTSSDSRLFVCELADCSASFNSRAALNGHIRIHGCRKSPPPKTTPQRQEYPCETCGKKFSKPKSRNAHKKTHLKNGKGCGEQQRSDSRDSLPSRTLNYSTGEFKKKPSPRISLTFTTCLNFGLGITPLETSSKEELQNDIGPLTRHSDFVGSVGCHEVEHSLKKNVGKTCSPVSETVTSDASSDNNKI